MSPKDGSQTTGWVHVQKQSEVLFYSTFFYTFNVIICNIIDFINICFTYMYRGTSLAFQWFSFYTITNVLEQRSLNDGLAHIQFKQPLLTLNLLNFLYGIIHFLIVGQPTNIKPGQTAGTSGTGQSACA